MGGARSAWARTTNFTYRGTMKKGYKQVNKIKGCRDVCLVMKKSTTGPQCTQTRGNTEWSMIDIANREVKFRLRVACNL